MSPFELAQRYVGIHELAPGHHPLIQWWLSLCGFPTDVADEVPWCSAFVNGICWELRLPRSKSAAARSWLQVGTAVTLAAALPGDIVVLKRQGGPGPDVLQAPGHVGFFAGLDGPDHVLVLGGNQHNSVSVARFPVADLLGIRSLQ